MGGGPTAQFHEIGQFGENVLLFGFAQVIQSGMGDGRCVFTQQDDGQKGEGMYVTYDLADAAAVERDLI